MNGRSLLTGLIVWTLLIVTGCGGDGGESAQPATQGMPGVPYAGDTYPSQIDQTEVTQTGNVFYVDPASGAIGNTGSASSPWNTLQAVIENNKIESREPAAYPYTEDVALKVKNSGAPVKAGDTIILKAGHHGSITILRYFNTQYINVIAEPGATVSKLRVTAGSKWRFKGLTVRPDAENASQYALVFLESHNWSGPTFNITVDDCNIYTVEDSTASWSQRPMAPTGIQKPATALRRLGTISRCAGMISKTSTSELPCPAITRSFPITPSRTSPATACAAWAMTCSSNTTW